MSEINVQSIRQIPKHDGQYQIELSHAKSVKTRLTSKELKLGKTKSGIQRIQEMIVLNKLEELATTRLALLGEKKVRSTRR